MRMLTSRMWRHLGTALLALISIISSNSEVRAEVQVATPAIDASIFKDGEIEDRNFGFGDWHAKCQQIIKIKRRICNLLSTVATDGRKIGSVIIATTDTGIPAMMIAIPEENSSKKAIFVTATHLGSVSGKAVKVEFSQVVNPMLCDSTCKYIFPLDPKLVFILNAGGNVQILPFKEDIVRRNKKIKPPTHSEAKSMTIVGLGFAETLNKSTAEW